MDISWQTSVNMGDFMKKKWIEQTSKDWHSEGTTGRQRCSNMRIQLAGIFNSQQWPLELIQSKSKCVISH